MAKTKKKLSPRERQSKKISRERATKKWIKSTSRRCGVALSAVSVLYLVGGGFWYWHSGKLAEIGNAASARYYAMTARMGFKVDEIFLDGRKNTEMKDVVRALDIEPGDPIFAYSVKELQAKLEALPSVHYAQVERELPGTLHIQIMERTPVAVWQHDGNRALLDGEGVVMEKESVADYPNLPVIVGEDAPDHMRDLYAFLVSETDLFHEVAAAVRMGERRWNIRMKNGAWIRLPEENASVAWAALAKMNREQKILARDISSIDLRLKDRVFIKLTPAAEGAAKNPPKET